MNQHTEHKTIFMESVFADIDIQCVSLVESLNSLGMTTLSSCQGDPGVIAEGGRYGHVAFTAFPTSEWKIVSRFVFDILRPFVQHMWDDVRLEVHCSEQAGVVGGFIGWIYFRNEALEEVSKRLGVYCEMTHR